MPDQSPYPVLVKCEDLAAWLLERTAKFPRIHRGGLCSRIDGLALDLLVALAKAAASPKRRRQWLEHASEDMDALRILVRLSVRLRVLSRRQYAYFATQSDEVGRMLGGWLRSLTGEASRARGGEAGR